MLLQGGYKDLSSTTTLLGTYHEGGNHWALIMVDLKNCLFTFLDPLVTSKIINGAKNKEAFEKWTLDYNKVKVIKSELLPTCYNRTLRLHAHQKDGTTCGIWTLWFAKQILEGKQIMHADIAREGVLIATEIMDASEPLQKICHKCGLLLSTSNYTVKMCQGNFRPQKVFYLNCIGEKYHKMIRFCC